MFINLDPKSVDLVLSLLQTGRWCDVNPILQEILKQLNDKDFQRLHTEVSAQKTLPLEPAP